MVLPPPRSTSSQPAASSSCCCCSFSLRSPRFLLTPALLPSYGPRGSVHTVRVLADPLLTLHGSGATRHYSHSAKATQCRENEVPRRAPIPSALVDFSRRRSDARVLERQQGSAASQPRALGAERDRAGAQPLGEPGRGAGVHAGPGRRALGPQDGLDLADERGLLGALPGRRAEPAAR